MSIEMFFGGLIGIVSGVNIIMTFIEKIKNPVNKIVDNKVKEVLEPINEKLTDIGADIIRLDKNQCKNYLTGFLEGIEKGEEKTEIEIQRATEVYDHYSEDLHLNSYIHDKWKRLMK